MKTCGHILFEMLGSNLCPDCRKFEIYGLKFNKTKTVLLMTCMRVIINHVVDIEI